MGGKRLSRRCFTSMAVAPPVAITRPGREMQRSDVVVVGAGIIGCSTAYHLALRGASVTVLDTRGVASSQSSKSWGFCRQQGRDARELDLMKESINRWQTIEDELGHAVGWQQGGNLALCDSAKRYDHFKTWLPLAAEHGLQTQMLSDKEVKELLPGLAGTWMGGVWTESQYELPQLRVRATAACTEKLTDLGNTFENFPNIGVWAPRVSFRKRPDGALTIADGGHAEEHEFEAYASTVHGWKYAPGYLSNPIKVNFVHDISHKRDPNPNPKRIDQATDSFAKLFPRLPQLRIREIWAAHIDMTPDMVPVIDVGGNLPQGVVVSTGYSGHGLGIAPSAGRLTADLALTGQRPAEAQAFRADRFSEKLFFKPSSVF